MENNTHVAERKEANSFNVHILTTQDEDGIFSSIALNLPGAGICGATETEALENAKEAIRGVIEAYAQEGQEIPWKDSSAEKIPFGAKQKWIIVHA